MLYSIFLDAIYRTVSTWGRNIDDGGVGCSRVLGLGNGVEDGEAEVFLASLPGGHASHHPGSILNSLDTEKG